MHERRNRLSDAENEQVSTTRTSINAGSCLDIHIESFHPRFLNSKLVAEHSCCDRSVKVDRSHGGQALCGDADTFGTLASCPQLVSGGSAASRLLQQDMPERRGDRPRGDGEDHLRGAQPRRPAAQAPFP
jgi:hypothetical protein